MYAVDLHTHSRFFHGFPSRPTAFDPVGARLTMAIARGRGLDGVAITNHDYSWLPGGRSGHARVPGPSAPEASVQGTAADAETAADGGGTGSAERAATVGSDAEFPAPAPIESDAPDDGPLAIPGIEISTTRGHLLVVGPDPPEFTTPETLSPDEAIDLAHDRGCAAIIPHPFRASTVRETEATVDAVEVNGKHTAHRERVALLAQERGCPIVGGSDAHYPVEVGRAYTRIEADELTPESVVAAIRDGRVEPAVHEYPLDRVLTPAYRAIHRLKGHLSSTEDGAGG